MKKTMTLITLSAFVTSHLIASTTWNVSLWGKKRAFTEHVEKIATLVEEKTNGDFKLNISYGGLSKSKENLDGISFGAFEMAQFCSFYHKGKNPTITVTELPFSKQLNLPQIGKIYQEVYKHPIVVKDLARWNATLLMPTPLPQYNIVSKSKDLNSLDDFEGLRVRGPGGIMSVLGKIGAIKTGVPFSEVRQAMNSGVIDGASFAPHAHLATKSFKVGNWATTNLNLGSANCPVVVNTDALNSLSTKNKEALIGSIDEALQHYYEVYGNTTKKYEDELKKSNVKLITFTPGQTAKLNELSQDVNNEWIKQYSKKFNSKELFNYTKNLFEKQ